MKIGILTFADVPNFGANLQAFSTVLGLKRMGHDPIIIRWEPIDFEARFTTIKNQPQPKEHFDFFQNMLPQTSICRNDDEICSVIQKENIDGIIIGSDAVLQCSSLWGRIDFPTKTIYRINKLTSEREYPNAFWGTFYDKETKKIPMAIMSASSQNAKYKLISRKIKNEMHNNLLNFSYISVRDTWTRDMIKNITKSNITPTITPDPVFAFNYNCEQFIPTKEEILRKYNLPENYILVSMKSRMLHESEWMAELKEKAKKTGMNSVALPMPTGVEFDHNFDYEIPTPLPPIDWFTLIKYASGYIGENMHPIVVCLHNGTPCFCFDTYGVLKYARCVCLEHSSKIYDVMKEFNLLSNRINAYSRFWKKPTVDFVLDKIKSFDIKECKNHAKVFYERYCDMMVSIVNSLSQDAQSNYE